jgi:signal transduction histidine kinase/ligand-binding sensor domain-containing protein
MKKLVLLSVFLSLICTAWCQYPEIHFERISDQQGLYDHWIKCLLQDSRGFIWIGGENGLYRFDGYNFICYKEPPACKNCPRFYPVYDVVEDNYNMLWTISSSGINLYSPEKEKSLLAYRFRSASVTGGSFYTTEYLDLMKDSRGNIWATHDKGLIKFSYKEIHNTKEIVFDKGPKSILNTKFIHLSHDTGLYQNHAQKIYEDTDGNIWVGCIDGLYVMRKNDTSFCRFEIAAEKRITTVTYIRDILQENDDTFWILSYSADYLMTNVKKALHGSVPDGSILGFMKFAVSKNQANTTLFKDTHNNIFISTDQDIYKYNGRKEKEVLQFESFSQRMPDKKDNISIKNTCSMIEDRSGIIWTGHQSFGILKFNPEKSLFMTYNNLTRSSFAGLSINTLHMDLKGNLWIGTSGGGLYRYQKETGQMNHYDLGAVENNITCMEEISPGIFWVGLGHGGLLEFNSQTVKLRDPLPEGTTGNNIRWEQVNDILKVYHQIYITTSYGLFVYDITKKRLVQFSYPANDSIYMNNWITSPVKLKNDEIFAVSTFHGINKVIYNAETGSLSLQCIVADSVLRSRNINLTQRCRLYQDSRGILWIVEKTGLHRIDPDKREITDYKLIKNIDFPEAWSITEDNHGNLWIGTLFGLCRFNITTGQTKVFSKEDGLPISYHQYNSVCKDKDGWLYFGGIGGLYSFHPDSIKTNNYIPPVVITDFRLFNKSIGVDTTKKGILKENISYTSLIELRYKQNDLTFEFAALDYNLPLKNLYAYKLEGYQDEWIETEADNRIATYTNLNPGKYVFRVKGSNNDRIWNEEGTSINIIIHPPFWKTIWAYIAYVFFFLLLLRGYIYWRTRLLRKEKIVLEKQVNERTEELKAANTLLEEHQEELQEVNTLLEEQKEELLQQKEELQSTLENLQKTQEQLVESEKMAALGGLVAGVAHEINTPVGIGITAISNLMEEVQKTADLYKKNEISRKDFEEFLQLTHDAGILIQRNLERTASLIQSFKQVSADQVSEQQRVFNLKSYLADIISSVSPKFKHKDIVFTVECDDTLEVNSFPGAYAQIFTNLLLNSFEHGFNEREKGIITIRADINDNMLKLEYRDDGTGISRKDLPHLFEPFYTSDKHRSTGLGLSIVYNLVNQKLHGTITCESEPGNGALFVIEMPSE